MPEAGMNDAFRNETVHDQRITMADRSSKLMGRIVSLD
jgi:hypothetical protein